MIAAGLVLVAPALAFAQDEKILSGNAKDDAAFADALVEKGYADLADKLLVMLDKKGGSPETAAAIKKVRLNALQDAAMKTDDLVKRKDALVKVLAEKLKFVDEAKGTVAAQDIHNTLPDLYDLIGQTLNSAMKKEKDQKVLEALSREGDDLFTKSEALIQARIEELKKIEQRTDEEEFNYQATRYNYARTLFFHAQVFAAGSGRRSELMNQAIHEYEEFDLEFADSIFNQYGYIDTGNCYKDLGKTKDALASFDSVIRLREGFEQDAKTGQYLVSSDAGNLVCYAMLQKMVLLKELKQHADVVAVGKDYFATIVEPWESPQSMAVADMLGNAQVDSGDTKGATDTAAGMKKQDPNGVGGYLAGLILERTGGGSYTDRLKSAQGKLEINDPDTAIAICRIVLAETAGTPEEADAGTDAWLLIGAAYQRRGWSEEASLAYQTAADRFPKAKGAVDALLRANECYGAAKRIGKRKLFDDRVNENQATLMRNWSSDPRVGDIGMVKAKQLESDGDLLGAIELYKTIPQASVNYTKALLLTGIDYFNHAQNLARDPKTAADAKAFYPQAEAAFQKVSDAIGQRRGSTLDKAVIAAYDTQEYLALISLAKLYMIPAFGRGQDAGKVIDRLEANSTWSKEHGPEIQNLRGKTYIESGQFDAAEKWIDDLVKRDEVAAASPAGQLARVLDAQGDAAHKAKPNSNEGDELWKRAARFYYMSVKPMIDGRVSQDADTMVDVGRRMMVYALHFNGVPETRQNFVDWTPGQKNAPDYFRKAAEIFKAGLEQNPDYRNSINLGRCYGFLKQWPLAADVYAKLFEQEPILTKDKRKLDTNVTKPKPELSLAYLEWGVAERMAYAEDQNKDRLTRCLNVIFTPLAFSLKPEVTPEAYWGAIYHLVMTLNDKGDYNDALLTIENQQRQVNPAYDEDKFGYKSRFDPVEADLRVKLNRPKK
jgi:tetratricopeptide (TPR) repeat protein